MRPIVITDVPFIFNIRHSSRGQWLNTTSPDIADQYIYFQNYIKRFEDDDEIYFIIFDKKLQIDVGIVRVTRLSELEHFGWEGLVLDPDTTPGVAIDVASAVYAMGFELLGRKECGPWKVLKSNNRVMKMHEMMQVAKTVDEDELNWIVSVKKEDFDSQIEKLRKRGFGCIQDEW